MTEALTILAAIALFAAFVWAQISANRANASRDVRERAEAN